MNGLRRRGTAAAISVLTLLAVAGWLQLSLGVRDTAAPVDGEALAGVVRAGISVARLAEAPDDAVAARRAQADLIAAISLVPRLPGDASRNELDALLISGLDTVQQITPEIDDAVAADVGELLARLAAGIDAEVAAMVVAPSDDVQQGASSTIGVVGLVLSLLAGIGALLLLLGRSTDAVPAAVVRAASRSPETAGRPSVDPVPSPEAQSRAAASLPLDVLDATHFQAAIERERSRSTRYGHDLSLMTVALVQEASIAQRHGADALEYVIGSVAELARDNTRASDIVGVVEGNQVVVLLPETSVADAEHAAGKLRRSVEIFPFSDDITPTISTTCSDATGAPA